MLSLARQKFISELTDIYSDVGEPKTHAVFASRECDSIHSFFIKALPMTSVITNPGAVAGYKTKGIVKGKGLGGLDKRTSGIGLAAAKNILEMDLKNIYSHSDINNPASVQAPKIARAIERYLLAAVVKTNDKTSTTRPAPATSGPVTGVVKGVGGILTDKPGTGYKAAKSKFKQEMTEIYSKIEKEYSAAQKAKEIAQAIHNFAIEGIVKTESPFIAPAAVSSETGKGNYFSGKGQSVKATLS
jgi:hypothetical protein